MDETPRYLLRDRDAIYGEAFHRQAAALRIKEVTTAPRSPWQNPYAERVIGSIRRECLDHVIILGELHLKRILTSYVAYYHDARTHLSLTKDAPAGRVVQPVGCEFLFKLLWAADTGHDSRISTGSCLGAQFFSLSLLNIRLH